MTAGERYRQYIKAAGLAVRDGQLAMVETAQRHLQGDPALAIVEAGTGIGKTLAYLLAALPVAIERDKFLVVSTATLALQSQLMQNDLPQLARHGGIEFDWQLVLGRANYLCTGKLQRALQGVAGPGLIAEPEFAESPQYARLRAALDDGWDGVRGSLDSAVDDDIWRNLASDKYQCTRDNCSHYQDCPWHKMRRRMREARVLVVNHALVMADVSLGGGVVLPPPERCIYVFDEAHRLAQIAASSLSHRLAAGPAARNLQRMHERLARMGADNAAELAGAVAVAMGELADLVARQYSGPPGPGDWIFQPGLVPPDIGRSMERLADDVHRLGADLEDLHRRRREAAGQSQAPEEQAACAAIAGWLGQLDGWGGLLAAWGQGPDDDAPPARWVAREDRDEYICRQMPTVPGPLLAPALWARCCGALLCSATLGGERGMAGFAAGLGLPEQVPAAHLASPFDYDAMAALQIPDAVADPREDGGRAHTRDIIRHLPQLLEAEQGGALVLFESWRQLDAVYNGLPSAVRDLVLHQNQHSKEGLIKSHRRRVDAGERSIIFGVRSMAEGVDLPGQYCTHLIIAKLPFARPDDPVGKTLEAWMRSAGRNYFSEVCLPQTARNLVQSAGRLIRREDDHGRLTIMDRRLLCMSYGGGLLDALPPFRRRF